MEVRKHFDVAENEFLLICIEPPLDVQLINVWRMSSRRLCSGRRKGRLFTVKKCKAEEKRRKQRAERTEEAGEDTLSLSTVKETKEMSCSTPTKRVCVYLRMCVSSCTH